MTRTTSLTLPPVDGCFRLPFGEEELPPGCKPIASAIVSTEMRPTFLVRTSVLFFGECDSCSRASHSGTITKDARHAGSA